MSIYHAFTKSTLDESKILLTDNQTRRLDQPEKTAYKTEKSIK